MKIVGHIFDPPLTPPEGVVDPKSMLEESDVLFWIAAMYFSRLHSEQHGTWDECEFGFDGCPLDTLCEDTDIVIQCDATQLQFVVRVHSLGPTFELRGANDAFRIVFRCTSLPPTEDQREKMGWDYRNKIYVDRIDGNEKGVFNYFVHLKLAGGIDRFSIVGGENEG